MLEKLIEKRHAGPGWVVLFEVGNGTGHKADRWADAVAVSIWPSHGFVMHGYEVKRSRGDLLRELEDPTKADAVGKYCDYWWLVVSDASIVDGVALPETWGVLVPRGGVLRASVKATKRPAAPWTPALFAAMARRMAQNTVPRILLDQERSQRAEIVAAEADKLAERKLAQFGNLRKQVEEYEKLRDALEGIGIWPWQPLAETMPQLRVAMDMVRDGDEAETQRQRLVDAVDQAQQRLAAARAALDLPLSAERPSAPVVRPSIFRRAVQS